MESKPVPLPRRKLPGSATAETENDNSHELNGNDGFCNGSLPQRPVPLPRTQFPKLPKVPTSQQTIMEESGESSDDSNLPACMLEQKCSLGEDDAKRKTISLFRRNLNDDPFGVDFEDSIRNAASFRLEEDSSLSTSLQDWAKFPDDNKPTCDSSSEEESCIRTNGIPPPLPRQKDKGLVTSYFPDSDLFNNCKMSGRNPEESMDSGYKIRSQLAQTGSTYERISCYSSSESGISSEDPNAQNGVEIESGHKPQLKRQLTFDVGFSSDHGSNGRKTPPPPVPHPPARWSSMDSAIMNGKLGEHVNFDRDLANKPKKNEYDEVTVENGEVVIVSKDSSGSGKTSDSPVSEDLSTGSQEKAGVKNPVILEFDPLFQKDISTSSLEDLDELGEILHRRKVTKDNSRSTANVRASMQLVKDVTKSPGKVSTLNAVDEDETPPAVPARTYKPAEEKRRQSINKTRETGESSSRFLKASESGIFKRISGMLSSSPTNKEDKSKLSDSEYSSPDRCKVWLNPLDNPDFAATLYKLQGLHKKEYVMRRGVLAKGMLSLYNNKQSEQKSVDSVALEKVLMAIRKDDSEQQNQGLSLFHFCVKSSKVSTMHLAASSEEERDIWLQKYVETFTNAIPSSITSNYEVAGWGYMKEGVISPWSPCWLVLTERKLVCSYQGAEEFVVQDLRKVRSITVKKKEEKSPLGETSDVLTVDTGTKILYFQTLSSKITGSWEKYLREATFYNGSTFEEMQLTNDNVPVIVEKCIEFLYGYGVIAEGIYRHSGVLSRMTGLLEEFKKDAWAVQISELTAHDVAGALKRFFRTLPEPLFTNKLYDEWIATYGIKNNEKKMNKYKLLLDQLPLINYNILKKLICHLYTIHELHDRNLMPLDNLAPIWGPTLMSVDPTTEDAAPMNTMIAQSYEIACAQCGVVRDLIENYYDLFGVNAEEIDREKKIQQVLEQIHFGGNKKRSGDIRIYVHFKEQNDGDAVNISLNPTATASQIVESLLQQKNVTDSEILALFEVIPSKGLERPLYPSERVMETVCRWPVMDDVESKTNYLIVKRNELYLSLLDYANDKPTFCGKCYFADQKTKSFRKCSVEFWNGQLRCCKESKGTGVEVEEGNIQDFTWFIGHDPKKTPPTQWNITCFPKTTESAKDTRLSTRRFSKDEQYFGNTLSFYKEEDMLKLVTAFILAKHPEGLFPSVIL